VVGVGEVGGEGELFFCTIFFSVFVFILFVYEIAQSVTPPLCNVDTG